MFGTKQARSIIRGQNATARIYKSGPASQVYLAGSIMEQGLPVAVVLPGQHELSQFKALAKLIFPNTLDTPLESTMATFPPCDLERGKLGWAGRWSALFQLVHASPKCCLITMDNLLLKLPPRDVVAKEFLLLDRKEEFLPDDILERAVAWGYRRVPVVTSPGEMALRGDILDIFCPGYDHALRFEFFGDALEDIRLFEPVSQRSVRDLDEAVLFPVSPCIAGPEFDEQARERWKVLWSTGELSKEGRSALEARLLEGRTPEWPGLFYKEPASISDYLPPDTVFFLTHATESRSKLEETQWDISQYLERHESTHNWSIPQNIVFNSPSTARESWMGKRQVLFESLVVGQTRDGVDLPEQHIAAFEDLFWKREQLHRPWHTLVDALKEWSRSKNQVILSFHTERSRKKFLHLIEEEGLSIGTQFVPGRRGIYALLSPLSKGFSLEWNQVVILAEDVLQPGERKVSLRERTTAFKGIKSFDDLEEGGLLVHRDYGLARFGGLHRLARGETSNDYLLLFYANDDRLYLPVDRLSLVQKYIGPEGGEPTLDRLGGVRWKNAKDRVKKAIEKIAQDLVDMYAFRKVAKGYEYGPLNEMYREFEASFGFEETPDQGAAINDVLYEMESPAPMDRLVCGDVGFGKTEVAMRAAFRAAMDGKQVALLCPTTVLAEQHFQNFSQRMQEFPLQVAMLSRFVPKARQTKILEALRRGEVDILIGTHRMLSKDVVFPNLGLLILDEEQRFGVKHKERIKTMRQNIDALTLTATPIPRTLQLSLSGIRSLSVIETPPLERKPVETALIQRDPELLKGVLERELARGGQVFWVSNRVQGLENVRDFVQAMVPTAKVGMAHGQMPAKTLEDAMHEFWHGETDILVCTSIIESGLDFPKANTLVVDNAQMFGLGQLYQLRGRVGRSERQAYAYFVVSSLDSIGDKARKRLQVIMDMDYLGAGFQVAMEDLRLRGAGNILGEAQSGNIGKIGLDLFLEMLEQEVSRLKGRPGIVQTDPELTIGFNANIPENYIPDSRERLKYYKALSLAGTDEELSELLEEISDRFGHLPSNLTTFVEVLRLKRILGRLQVFKAELSPHRIVLTWSEDTQAIDPAALIDWMRKREDRTRLVPPSKLEIRADSEDITQALAGLQKELEELIRI
ncbi:MAG: transcription-repair coupling factor [bacterium]